MIRHKFTAAERSRGGKNNSTKFKRGHKHTGHVLTAEDRFKGGMTRWAMTMAEVRLSMNLPLPTAKIRAAAKRLIKRKVKDIYISTFENLKPRQTGGKTGTRQQ
jgi:hypothetical protein